MKKPSYLLASVAALASASTLTQQAAAQADVNPPLPNVMLAVDSSGSMEYRSSSASFPACTTGSTQKSRWVELVEVLTGSIQDYSCQAVNRGSTAFRDEYSLAGTTPADFQYVNPYHRPVSGSCTPGPGTLPVNAYDFPLNGIAFHDINNRTQSCTTFNQASDGLLDTFLSRVRFGLMTFDTHVHSGTGVTGTSPTYGSGVNGAWSYFLGTARQGRPVGCETPYDQEVGARNAAAPPWEGRMVAFGDPTGGSNFLNQKNQQIQQILLALRPYGATPIAGMLDDARNFLWNDTTRDPLNASQDFGPYRDPYLRGGCRKNFVVLLSDGEPNLDLRPFCVGAAAPGCPYDTPEQISFDLAHASDPKNRVKVFVIGFAVSQVTLQSGQQVDCKTLSQTDLTSPQGVCAQRPNERSLQACCTLNRIAYEGGTNRAQFADNVDELRSAMSGVLSSIAATTTSRTVPVFAAGSASGGGIADSYRFFTSFEPQQFQLWSGVIERQRFVCEKVDGVLQPTALPVDASKGDDFAQNVNSRVGAARTFYTVVGENRSGIFSQRSIRPNLGASLDGAGTYTGAPQRGGDTALVAAVPPEAMGLDNNSCEGLTSAGACRDRYLKWTLGLDNGTIYNRCRSAGSATCSLVGDVYHSTPRLVGRPSEFLRDETYQLFADKMAQRPLVLYTSTNDGFLHAFKVAAGDKTDTFKVNSKSNNELWAFIPPAVLPAIPSQYPSTHQLLLDGLPIVKDVVAYPNSGKWIFDRTPSNARTTEWRTILVQSFGGTRGGYFALDITNPVPDATASLSDPNAAGPRFLWQLTQDDNGNPLFGTQGATPLITTLFFADGSVEKEVAVAILPGGQGGVSSGSCARSVPNPSDMATGYSPRTAVPCYPAQGIGGRSLTIVRLDSGEIIRTFRRDPAEVPAALRTRVNTAPIDSPITGQPAAFPGETGAIADRVFVGDRDGTVWRVDLSSTNPANWTMKLFFDAFWDKAAADGQPIQAEPIVSVDTAGSVTVAFATGDQEVLTAPTGMTNRVVSLTEKLNTAGTAFGPKLNWYQTFSDGERVAGPMSLFTGSLFFSTFKPEPATSTNVCRPGLSRVWGMDYITPNSATRNDGGKPRLPRDQSANPTLVQMIDTSSALFDDGAVIFGVGVAQLPTCIEEGAATSDPYFGGTHASMTTVQPGQFQLVMHTGNSGTAVQGGRTNVLTLPLTSPANTPRIDSWAAITQ
ncbi:MAG TPA: hypothetical protein VK524_19410 [Polyangiaceae bacterium]|nr:hypothetical protein [Polyangiaceae bacterium]